MAGNHCNYHPSCYIFDHHCFVWSEIRMIFKSPEHKTRDRAISVALALVIGVVIGVGGWLYFHRPDGGLALAGRPLGSAASVVLVPVRPLARVDMMAIQPHKALYDIKLKSAKNGSQVINIGGKMYYQLQHSCDQWITDHRFALDYEYADAAPLRITSDFSTVESQDGRSFDFTSRRRRDGEIYQELRGKAMLDAKGVGRAVYTQPDDLAFDMPKKAYFPTQHTKELLAAARAGKKFLAATVFDGTDEEGPVDITALIGARVEKAAFIKASASLDTDILDVPGWRIHLAFFPQKAPDGTADYELTMVLHENGIISDMTIDYDDFSVTQTLTALEKLKPEECRPAGVPDPSGAVAKPSR